MKSPYQTGDPCLSIHPNNLKAPIQDQQRICPDPKTPPGIVSMPNLKLIVILKNPN
ncbi:MAG: hypothetical protein ACTSRA_21390 [Promethearchaeota archaeon]